jgi:hypothetical protein
VVWPFLPKRRVFLRWGAQSARLALVAVVTLDSVGLCEAVHLCQGT